MWKAVYAVKVWRQLSGDRNRADARYDESLLSVAPCRCLGGGGVPCLLISLTAV